MYFAIYLISPLSKKLITYLTEFIKTIINNPSLAKNTPNNLRQKAATLYVHAYNSNTYKIKSFFTVSDSFYTKKESNLFLNAQAQNHIRLLILNINC